MIEGRPCLPPILFHSYLINFVSASSNRLQLSFAIQAEGLVFHCDQALQKINSKTVQVALQRSDQRTVRAKLIRRGKLEYHLMVTVSEEFLLPIEEIIVFVGKEMSKEEKQKYKAKRQGKKTLQKMKKEVAEFAGQCMESGSIKSSIVPTSIAFQVPFKTTLFTFCLNFTNLQEKVIFVEFYYLDEKKGKVEMEVVPKQGLFLWETTDICLLVKRNTAEKIFMEVRGAFDQMSYLVKQERVEDLTATSSKRRLTIFGAILLLIFLAIVFLDLSHHRQDSEEKASMQL